MDKLGNTAGEIALSFNDTECYNLIRDAGIRQELLLNLLSSRSLSEDDSILALKAEDSTGAGDTAAFLASKLTFKQDHYGQDICVVQAGADEIGDF